MQYWSACLVKAHLDENFPMQSCLRDFTQIIPVGDDYHHNIQKTEAKWGTPLNAMRYAYSNGFSRFQTYKNPPYRVFEHLVKNLRCNVVSGWFFFPEEKKGGSFTYKTKGPSQSKTIQYVGTDVLKNIYWCPELTCYVFPEEVQIPECVAAFYDTMYFSEAIAHFVPGQDGYYDLLWHFESIY